MCNKSASNNFKTKPSVFCDTWPRPKASTIRVPITTKIGYFARVDVNNANPFIFTEEGSTVKTVARYSYRYRLASQLESRN